MNLYQKQSILGNIPSSVERNQFYSKGKKLDFRKKLADLHPKVRGVQEKLGDHNGEVQKRFDSVIEAIFGKIVEIPNETRSNTKRIEEVRKTLVQNSNMIMEEDFEYNHTPWKEEFSVQYFMLMIEKRQGYEKTCKSITTGCFRVCC